MSKYILPLLLTLSIPCAAVSAAPPTGHTNSTPSLSAPKDTQAPVFSGSIYKRLALSGLAPLQNTVLPAGDLEVRIWEGFGEDGFKGYILHRTRGTWSAVELLPVFDKDSVQQRQRVLPPPKSGWASFWSKLQAKGLLTLPDDLAIPDRKIILDGRSYVVEILNGNQYRTYHYNNPDYQASPLDRQMVGISKLIHEEFKISMAIFFP